MTLSRKQKKAIDSIVHDEEGLPGDVTLGMAIQKKLNLSDVDYKALENEIEAYLLSFG